MTDRMRIGVASIIQETNTFSPVPTTMGDFMAQGLWVGNEVDTRSSGTNTEIAGAIAEIRGSGAEAVPIVRAWAMSGGTLTDAAYVQLKAILDAGLRDAGRLDALVLCLHGALVAERETSADRALCARAREILGKAIPIVVTHDLHANVTGGIVSECDALIGFHTYPHIDQGDTGRRAARLALGLANGALGAVGTEVVKRPMIIPPECQAIADEPMASLRQLADDLSTGGILDISLFPVQPWLDVPDLGVAVTVTHAGEPTLARDIARGLMDEWWQRRGEFVVNLVSLDQAMHAIRRREPGETILLVQSADSPTAGATADDASVIARLARDALGVRSIATVVDAGVVAECHERDRGHRFDGMIGSTLDQRWALPERFTGFVTSIGEGAITLHGESMTGQDIVLGRWATIDTQTGLSVLVTERPAPTFDPEGFRQVGLDPEDAEVIVVRSATMYRAAYRHLNARALVLGLPGASTPAFGYLDFVRAPRPLFPIDAEAALDECVEGRA